jgi:hypothetical protein
MTPTALETFRSRVSDDPDLLGRLWKIGDRGEFVAACLAVAAEWGLALAEDDLREAMQSSYRAWVERNLP